MFSSSPAISSNLKRCSYSSPPLLIHSLSSSPTSNHQKPLSLLLQAPLSPPHLLQAHARIFRVGADQDDLVATRLIGRYPSRLALRVFYHLHNPNIFPFNAIIRILAEDGLVLDAISVFKTLIFLSLSPNDFTFSFLLKACFRSTDSVITFQVHNHIIKSGFDQNSVVCNGLLAVYAKGVRDLFSARKVFDEIPCKEMVCSWTCLIAGYAQLGRSEEAMLLFLQMVEKNLIPENDTMVSILSACSNLEPQEIGRWESVLSEFGGYNDADEICRDAIDTVRVYLYGKIGEIQKSRDVFDKMSESVRGRRSVLTWNAMIGGYMQNGHPMEALGLFRLMVTHPSVKPNHVTMVSVLSACAQVGDLDLGRWVHEYMKVKGRKAILESNSILATAFIDMYSKCGSLERAREIFDRMSTKDAVSFNAMIMGLAINGQGEEALELFSKMEDFGIQPNDGTFVGMLCACNHSGLVSEGRSLFMDIQRRYSATPKLEHYACFVDLLARAGHVGEALAVVRAMHINPNGMVWGALLGACLLHSRADLAPYVARRLVDADPKNSAGYVMLSNALAVDQQWGEIEELRGLMKARRVWKQPGRSWISVDGVVHEFLVGSTSHPQIQRIYHILDGLFKEMRLPSH
ncbi:pentatricopeptide repeat-containing protein At1g08070, chloroplastic-like [Magnolia sinica]|uniref:pentatricopeptide repeat-containing protein At1g08070, chloroplastic-like n=1 Tax=Magnolia sinica TaxID=86752 RepID=UPI00265918D3|nr:pentatricopeptide repeat-containing protein At1g08070, chloroplastic-like [Magnolia sinica]